MRHRKAGVKLNMTSSHKNAMFRNMVTSLFKYDRIRTTDTKAKELRRWADHMITLAKRGDLHARRQAMSVMREKNVVHKLFEEASDRFGEVSGGYTRVIKLGRRPGDAALISLIELITPETRDKKKKPAKKAKPVTPKKVDEKVEDKGADEAAEEQSAAAEATAAEISDSGDKDSDPVAENGADLEAAKTEAENEEASGEEKTVEPEAEVTAPEATEPADEVLEEGEMKKDKDE